MGYSSPNVSTEHVINKIQEKASNTLRQAADNLGGNTGRIITLALGDGVARSVSGVSERCRR